MKFFGCVFQPDATTPIKLATKKLNTWDRQAKNEEIRWDVIMKVCLNAEM